MEFPSLKKVELRSFSLYRNRPELSLDLDYPVFCLAGANGLGKSTFLKERIEREQGTEWGRVPLQVRAARANVGETVPGRTEANLYEG